MPRAKIEGYLLSDAHPEGRFKARFFRGVGFTAAVDLERALLEIALQGRVTALTTTGYGQLYVVDGEVASPTGILVALRTVWIVETDANVPRLVTAYPKQEL